MTARKRSKLAALTHPDVTVPALWEIGAMLSSRASFSLVFAFAYIWKAP